MAGKAFRRIMAKRQTSNEEPRLVQVMALKGQAPDDFIYDALMLVFNKSADEAKATIAVLNEKGSCVLGTYTDDIARTKAKHVEIEGTKDEVFLVLGFETVPR